MNGAPEAILADTAWWHFSFNARTLGILLWIGLGVLTVSLFLLSRTRWGQARPLSKCVVLSIFAHLLLVGYAYSTRLILEVPPPADRQVIRLTVVEPGDQRQQAWQQDPAEPEPWERFPTEPRPLEELTMPERLAAELQSSGPRPIESEVPRFEHQLLADVTPLPEPKRPLPATTPHPSQRPNRPGGEAPSIERPRPQRQAAAEVVKPQVDGPPPAQVPLPAGATPRRPMATERPGKLLDDPTRVEQLAELPLKTTRSQALASSQDLMGQLATQSASMRHKASPASSLTKEDLIKPDAEQGTERPTGGPAQGGARPEAAVASADATVSTGPLPRRVGDGKQLPSLYQSRVADNRSQIVAEHGGSSRTEAAVRLALQWLADHQSPDGRWDASLFGAGTETQALGHNRQRAGSRADTGITGLALLAFLASGHTHLEGPFRSHINRGLQFLLRSQQPDGNLGSDAGLFAMMYCHGIASLALSESYAITGDARLKPAVERAVAFTVRSQHPTGGGWRYRPGDQGDMSQFGWQVMALKSAQLAGINIPERTRVGMLRFLAVNASGQHGGLAAYRSGEQVSAAMTAEALTCRFFLGLPVQRATIEEATRLIMQQLPGQGKPNLYYWYYATLALYQSDSPQWPAWNDALKRQLIGTQRTDGDHAGSWDPDTVWGGYGGRVYSTAMAALCLQVYYRYLPVAAR